MGFIAEKVKQENCFPLAVWVMDVLFKAQPEKFEESASLYLAACVAVAACFENGVGEDFAFFPEHFSPQAFSEACNCIMHVLEHQSLPQSALSILEGFAETLNNHKLLTMRFFKDLLGDPVDVHSRLLSFFIRSRDCAGELDALNWCFQLSVFVASYDEALCAMEPRVLARVVAGFVVSAIFKDNQTLLQGNFAAIGSDSEGVASVIGAFVKCDDRSTHQWLQSRFPEFYNPGSVLPFSLTALTGQSPSKRARTYPDESSGHISLVRGNPEENGMFSLFKK